MSIGVHDCRLVVQNHYKLTKDEMTGAKRPRWIARPRQMAMALAREFTRASLPRIGLAFGGRDHTTVIHAQRKVKALEKSDPDFGREMKLFRGKLAELSLALMEERAMADFATMSPEEWRANV